MGMAPAGTFELIDDDSFQWRAWLGGRRFELMQAEPLDQSLSRFGIRHQTIDLAELPKGEVKDIMDSYYDDYETDLAVLPKVERAGLVAECVFESTPLCADVLLCDSKGVPFAYPSAQDACMTIAARVWNRNRTLGSTSHNKIFYESLMPADRRQIHLSDVDFGEDWFHATVTLVPGYEQAILDIDGSVFEPRVIRLHDRAGYTVPGWTFQSAVSERRILHACRELTRMLDRQAGEPTPTTKRAEEQER